MTSQVAITLLKSLEQSLDSYCGLNDEGKTAFRMAIESLELFGNSEHLLTAQPNTCEIERKSNDMISRQAVTNTLARWLKVPDYNEAERNIMKATMQMLSELPTVQPERKRMTNKEWIDFLSEQFDISRTSAREMLHGMMKWKGEDNFKKQFCRKES